MSTPLQPPEGKPPRAGEPAKSLLLAALVARATAKNVLSGLMFVAIGALGLWLSRDYPVGSLRRMGTGYMPQLLCWVLMGLGAIVLGQGLVDRPARTGATKPPSQQPQQPQPHTAGAGRENLWSIGFVAASLVAFALAIGPLGLVAAICLLVVIASFAYRGLGWRETIATAVVLVVLSWLVFVLGLGMNARMLPEL